MTNRILVIINTLNVGGAETFIMKVFRSIDKSKVLFDFLVCEKDRGVYEKEVEQLGGQVYHGYYKIQHPLKNFFSIYKTVKSRRYKTVFIFSQHPVVLFDLLACLLGGAKKRIVRSTNSSCGGSASNYLARLFRPLMNMFVTERLAPSKEAASWLFGERIVEKGDFKLINNGLDLKQFSYSDKNRIAFRHELGVEDSLLVGHVGRFNEQKNHLFLLDIFNELYKLNKKARLVLIGKGELKDDIQEKVGLLHLENVVLFLDVRNDIPYCLSGIDLFLFPSLYEGMPNTVIEAQACGLPCLVSDTITPDAKITDLVEFESLESSPIVWAQRAMDMADRKINRNNYNRNMREKGYSIEEVSDILMKILL